MYGVPLFIDVQSADNILCVVRRLELIDLEQQIWKFLMSAIDIDNCDLMHELADRYDCPALKLAAFKALKEKEPAYAVPPDRLRMERSISSRSKSKMYDNGLIGPGERNITKVDRDRNNDEYNDGDEENEEEEELPSVLKYRRGSMRQGAGVYEDNYYEEDIDDDEEGVGPRTCQAMRRRLRWSRRGL
jgi:hypothetical protein